MNPQNKLAITFTSFGFKYGIPDNIQYLWDVRFLPNPYWQDSLRLKSGLDSEVYAYVVESNEGAVFLSLQKPLLSYVVQQHMRLEKEKLHLACGCTGGRHRSVAIVEALKDSLAVLPVEIKIEHRDILKG